ncbi:MAG: S4 domain-containing protein [Anaerolineales bacterium]
MRLDLLLVERDLVESRNQAQKLIMAGQVRVDDQIVLKPSTKVLQNLTSTWGIILPLLNWIS